MNKSASFIQDQAHLTKSGRFQPIKPEYVETCLNQFGFDLVDLKTGVARNADRASHQTTLARYRSKSDFKINGLNLDIVFKIPHLYGALEGFLGTFRQVCSNGLTVGDKFDVLKIKHLGDPIKQLEYELPRLVAQEAKLIETIQQMQQTELSYGQAVQFAKTVLQTRLGEDALIKPEALLVPQRFEDQRGDLFTVLNVIQENSLRSAIPYTRPSRDANGALRLRNMTTRATHDGSAKALEINRLIWNTATDLMKVA